MHDGVQEKTIRLPGGADAFLAFPSGSGESGAVIVVHEIFGLVDHIKDVTARFAKAGFVALAPDLYEKQAATSLEE